MDCRVSKLLYLEAGNELWVCDCGKLRWVSRSTNVCSRLDKKLPSFLGPEATIDESLPEHVINSSLSLVVSPKFSVITPVRQSTNYILQLAKSLCWQTVKDFEWVVVEDGNSGKLEQQVLASGLNCKFAHTDLTNGWGNLQRNVAIGMAVGEYVCFIDDDDLPLPNWLEDMFGVTEDVVIKGVNWPESPYFEKILPFDGAVRVGTVSTQNITVRSTIAKEVGWPVSSVRENDFRFIENCLKGNRTVLYDPKVGVILNGFKVLQSVYGRQGLV